MIHSRADSLAQMDSEDVVKASVLSGHNESILVKLKQLEGNPEHTGQIMSLGWLGKTLSTQKG